MQSVIPLTQPQQAPAIKPPLGATTQPIGTPKPAAAPIDLGMGTQVPTAPKPAAQPQAAAQSTVAAPAAGGTSDPLAFATQNPPSVPVSPPTPAPPTQPTAPVPTMSGGTGGATAPAPHTGIYSGDPTRPGAGYIDYNGQPYRIEGTTAAGLDEHGNPRSVEGATYILQDPTTGQELIGPNGQYLGPQVNADDYMAWINASHGATTPDNPPGGTPSTGPVGSTPNAPAGGNGVGTTPTNPADSLIGQTIAPDNTVDRVQLAQDALNNTIENVLDPQYQADLRSANRLSFGQGRGVSGMNRTSLGNVQSDYERSKANLTGNLLNAATTGSIDDLYRNIGIAQQQQGFQRDLLNDAFSQGFQTQQLSDAERQELFNEALQQFYAGNISDPAQFYEFIAGQYARPVGGTT